MFVVPVKWEAPDHRTGWTVMRFAQGGAGPTVCVARARAFFSLPAVRSFVPNDFRFVFGFLAQTLPTVRWDMNVEERDDVTDAVVGLHYVSGVGNPLQAQGGGVWRDGVGVRVMLNTGVRGGHGVVRGHWKLVPYTSSSASGRPNTANLSSLQTAVSGWLGTSIGAGAVPVVYRRPSTAGGGNVLPVISTSVPNTQFTQMTRRRRRFPGPPPQPPLP